MSENNGWISAKNNQPEIKTCEFPIRSDMVLCFGLEEDNDTFPHCFIAYVIKGGRFYNGNGECFNVTHWQPLPKPPTE